MCEQPELLVKADWKTEEFMSCLALSENNDGYSVLLNTWLNSKRMCCAAQTGHNSKNKLCPLYSITHAQAAADAVSCTSNCPCTRSSVALIT